MNKELGTDMHVVTRALAIKDYEDLHEVMLMAYEDLDEDPWV